MSDEWDHERNTYRPPPKDERELGHGWIAMCRQTLKEANTRTNESESDT